MFPNPDNTFIGYKCPYDICTVITESHSICDATRRRLDAISNEPHEFNWLSIFTFNYKQWMVKNKYSTFDSVPS